MAKGGEQRFGIKIDSNAKDVGREGASALEQLRAKVEANASAVRGYSDTLRRLKGTSAEVVSAKAQLKAKIDAERMAMSQNTLAILKAGTSYDKLTAQHKKLADELKKNVEEKAKNQTKALGGALQGVGGPLADLESKFSSVTDVIGGADGAMGLLAVGAVAAVAAIALVAVGLVSLTAAAFAWVAQSANMLRTQQLTREAFVGNAEDARRLGNQIDSLAGKVPTARAQLNEMATDLAQAGLKGQTLVDALNAVGQTSAALNSQAGNQIKGLIERGKLSGRFALGQLDTQGTGIKFADVAAALAKNTKTSVAQASAALMQGQVLLGDGAKAMRDAVEKKFGKVNLAKMLDLDVLKQKFTDTLTSLTGGVNLEPLLSAFSDLMTLFDGSTQSGSALKDVITVFGNEVIGTIVKVKPLVKQFIEQMVLFALQLEIKYLELKIRFKDAFGDDAVDKLGNFVSALTGINGPVAALLNPFSQLLSLLTFIGKGLDFITSFENAADRIYKRWSSIPWGDIGASIVAGIVGPLRTVVDTASGIADDMVKAIKARLGIASPSKVMKEIGEHSASGLAKGVDAGNPKVDAAIARTAGTMTAGASPSGGGPSPTINITVPITINGGGEGKAGGVDELVARVRAEVLLALELGLRQAGYAP